MLLFTVYVDSCVRTASTVETSIKNRCSLCNELGLRSVKHTATLCTPQHITATQICTLCYSVHTTTHYSYIDLYTLLLCAHHNTLQEIDLYTLLLCAHHNTLQEIDLYTLILCAHHNTLQEIDLYTLLHCEHHNTLQEILQICTLCYTLHTTTHYRKQICILCYSVHTTTHYRKYCRSVHSATLCTPQHITATQICTLCYTVHTTTRYSYIDLYTLLHCAHHNTLQLRRSVHSATLCKLQYFTGKKSVTSRRICTYNSDYY